MESEFDGVDFFGNLRVGLVEGEGFAGDGLAVAVGQELAYLLNKWTLGLALRSKRVLSIMEACELVPESAAGEEFEHEIVINAIFSFIHANKIKTVASIFSTTVIA